MAYGDQVATGGVLIAMVGIVISFLAWLRPRSPVVPTGTEIIEPESEAVTDLPPVTPKSIEITFPPWLIIYGYEPGVRPRI
jgi:hypothetical protein